ncbi:MAG: oligosaccharide flippase family protein [Prevotella sp.]|nr:oligosaccharide flippase family protein [Prevotella sp.]
MSNEERNDSYSHVLKYTSIFGGVQGLNILMGLVRNKLVAVLLGPEGMGLASLFQTTVNFISQATNLGISFSAVRNVSELFDAGDTERILHFVKVVRSWSLLTGLVGMLVCMVIGPLLNAFTFSWGDHTLHFILLSPLVMLLAVTGGETAILKGARQLRSLAAIQILNVVAALLIAVPMYYLFGQTGIVPVMVMMGLASMFFTIRSSYRLYPLRLGGATGVLGEGMGMVRLGVAFTLAGILGSGADFVVRSWLNVNAGLDVVGLYNTAYMMTMTYAGLIFSAMETDFFPRLSAANHDIAASNEIINKQVEVSLLLISPMLVLAQFALPIAVPLLLSYKFLPIVDMMRLLLLALYLRSVKLPVAYLPLAKGDAVSYLILEAIYDVAVVIFIIMGYTGYGLVGTGMAITLVAAFDYLLIIGYAHYKYSYRPTAAVMGYMLLHYLLGLMAFAVAMFATGWQWWVGGMALTLVALGLSVYTLHKKASLWQKLIGNLRNKFRRNG